MEDIIALMIPIIAISGGLGLGALGMHHKHKERMMGQMTEGQVAELEQMSRVADILDQRVNVLERILDDEVPEWRERSHDKTI
ncbi:MAG: envelope stress response membrane protein PspB [Maricaulaceae bacterium]